MPRTQYSAYFSYKLALIAGLVGGATEILWLMFLCRFLPLDLAEVARQTALSIYIFSQTSQWLILWGIAIHISMSMAVGLLFAYIINRSPDALHKITLTPLLSIAFLLVIWIVNFALILPILNPTFMALMPLIATLMSKVLFGCGMGITFVWAKGGQVARISKARKRSKH